MSRTTTRKPEFRLLLGYAYVTLTGADRPEPIGTATPGSPAFTADLRYLVGKVARAGGRLTVVLPEAEVWRGRLEPSATRSARLGAARALAAAHLGIPPQEVALVVAASGAAAAGTRRSTLAETRRLVGAVGMRPDAIVGDGAFDGFPAPPVLGGHPPLPGFALGGGAGALAAAAAALYLALPSDPPAPAVAHMPPSSATIVAEAAATPKPPAKAAPAPVLALLHAAPPPARPKPQPPATPLPAPVTQATRNVDFLWVAPEQGGAPDLRLAELTTARARMTDATMEPLHRPAAALAPATAPAPQAAAELRPMHRPAAAAPPVAAPAVAAQTAPDRSAAADFGRPKPRPDEPGAVKLASLAPEAAAIAGLAAASVASAPPPARPAGLRTAPATPPRVVKPAPKPAPKLAVAKPKPAAAPPPAPAKPQPVVTAAPQRVVTAAPQRVVTAAPQRVVTAAPQRVVTAAPQRVVAVAPTTAAKAAFSGPVRSGITRGNVSLIGIFGGADGRHALLRLPNGQIERVRAGDSVQGMQVAAVGKELVQISGRGRNTLLLLPD